MCVYVCVHDVISVYVFFCEPCAIVGHTHTQLVVTHSGLLMMSYLFSVLFVFFLVPLLVWQSNIITAITTGLSIAYSIQCMMCVD